MISIDEGSDTRAHRFGAVAVVLLSSMAINKLLVPSLSAEAILANIHLRTC